MADNRAQKGLLLKQAREAKGITLEAVQDATKIPLDSLKAIEEGYRVRTLTDFYYRAFVKMYAKYLGVDIASIIENYKPEQLPKPAKFHKGKNFWQDEKIPFFNKDVIKNVMRGLFIFLVLFMCFRLGSCWFKSRSSQPTKPVVKLRKVDVKRNEKVKPPEEKKVSLPRSSVSVAPAPSSSDVIAPKRSNKKITLVVKTKKSTWISIRVDGVDMSRTSLSKGAVESWTASESIELSGKNLNDLEFELNGQPTNPFGKTRRGVKKILINHEGFKIED